MRSYFNPSIIIEIKRRITVETYIQKTIHTGYRDMDIAIPSDYNGEYESQLIKKYQSNSRQGRENTFYVC